MRLGRPARKLWHEMVFLSKSTTFPSMVRRTLLKPPVVTRFPDGYMKTGSSGLPHPKDFWRCHWFFRAATRHIPLIFLKGKRLMNSPSGDLILASLMCSKKLSDSFLYCTQAQVRVHVGSVHVSEGDSSSPIQAVPKNAVRLADQIA